MKRIISVLKNNFKIILALILGMLLAGTGVYAATTLASSSVAYDNSTSGGSSTNVKGALDELYDMASTHCPDGYECYKNYKIGEEVTIASEKFNVVSQTVDTVTMLAQYNLGTDYKQSTTENAVPFSDTIGWEYTPGPKEIDIQLYDGNAKTYVNEYVAYLKSLTEDSTISGNLITMNELKVLECNTSTSYGMSGNYDCNSSSYSSWIINSQKWWTRSAYTGSNYYVWLVNTTGALYPIGNTGQGDAGIRPTITISKSTLENL